MRDRPGAAYRVGTVMSEKRASDSFDARLSEWTRRRKPIELFGAPKIARASLCDMLADLLHLLSTYSGQISSKNIRKIVKFLIIPGARKTFRMTKTKDER